MFKLIKKYFNWLQKDNPTGTIDLFPELSEDAETSLKGVYIIGDLTGIPLLKFATAGGARLVRKFASINDRIADKKVFDKIQSEIPKNNTKDSYTNEYDLVIIGAGPAGISAALEASMRGLSFVVLEATDRLFNTIEGFPKGKPMFYEPQEMADDSKLTMQGATKEDLLNHMKNILQKENIEVLFNKQVNLIEVITGGKNKITTNDGNEFIAHKTLLAIGKSGNSRKLNIPGEELSHVFTKLFDPKDYQSKNILVVGGGDTAIENAMLLASAGNFVSLSYRKKELTRPKAGNIIKLNELVEQGKIKLLLGSDLKQVHDSSVDILLNGESQNIKIDNIFVLIGRQLPYEFFKRCGIKIENAKTKMTWWWMAFSLSFANIIYFGKASDGISGHAGAAMVIDNIFNGNWVSVVTKFITWLSVFTFFFILIVVLYDLLRNWKKYFINKWAYIKYGYFSFVIVVFLISFFGSKYFNFNLGQKDPYYWYGFLYTTTILLFGVRRILVTKTRYVFWQTISVILIQALPLFIIPSYILPWMHNLGWINTWVYQNVFMGGQWWRFVGFILAWPLFIWNVISEEPSIFWLIVSLLQTFVIIPLLVIRWGKGIYCSWICSCGAMAETLGDEYRSLAPHGPVAKKWENLGQVILFSIFIISILHMLGWVPSFAGALAGVNSMLIGGYKIIVDTFLAGTIGVGLYFFYSGRLWCRFACPLAALMHIYNKFSIWRILADKKKCISCGLCTKACHMGIDVMNYANKGKPLEDVECVNCSACINVCPTGVLSFGKYKKIWKKD